MRAVLHQGSGLSGLRVDEIEAPVLGADEVRVRLEAAALNHRDLWTCKGRNAGEAAVVLGSDGAGRIVEIGEAVRDLAVGAEVVVNPSLGWLQRAEAPPDGFEILGYPRHGTLAESVAVPRANVEAKPAHLTWDEAAALPLSGLTAWRALFSLGRVAAGQTVVVPGAGGGTALQAALFAKQAGARVAVTSSSAEKRHKLHALGFELALDSAADWADEVRHFSAGAGADVVIESVGAVTWASSLACLARGGRIVVYGSTSGDVVETDLVPLFLNWRAILGTTMGNREEFRAMLAFVNEHRLRPVVDRMFTLAEGVAALEYLAAGSQLGKVVLRVAAA